MWLITALVMGTAAFAFASPPGLSTDIAVFEQAEQALASGDFARAASLATLVAEDSNRDVADRIEAYRMLGVALFHLSQFPEAEEAFFSFLKLDAAAHLDPAKVPPEVIVFFESVRARRADELRATEEIDKPSHRSWLFNLLPPAGQFMNGEPVKGIAIAGVGGALLAVNLSSYFVLQSWCDEDRTCEGHNDSARTLRVVNIVSGVSVIGVYVIGVIDGWRGQRRVERQSSVLLSPTDGGAVMGIHHRF